MLRALADSENTKKRAIRDREDATKYAVSAFAKDLLAFSDNFNRALSAIPDDLPKEDELIESIVNGLVAMEKELLATFEKHGIEKLDPIDHIFDPHYHEVMFESSTPDKKPGIIIQVLEPGYTLNGRLLRPARVGVAKDEGKPGKESGSPGGKIDQKA